jgi:hypothetical protein
MFDQVAADLRMLATANGAQVRCLECVAMSGVPIVAKDGNGASHWLRRLFTRS